jgi:hypothetical protein
VNRGRYLIAAARAGELAFKCAAFSGTDSRAVMVVRADIMVGRLLDVDAMISKGSKGLFRGIGIVGNLNLPQIVYRKSMVCKTNSQFSSMLELTL